MTDIFPIGVKSSHIKGLTLIMKEHDNEMSVSELGNEAEEEIDDLLPTLIAGKVLGFLTMENGIIKLTAEGASLNSKSFSKTIAEKIPKIEPFYTIIKEVEKQGEVKTRDIFKMLSKKGLIEDRFESGNYTQFRKNLLNWSIKSKILVYDQLADTWKIATIKI